MGKKVFFLFGLGVACLGLFGVYNAINSFGKAPVEKEDLTTTGIVTHKEATELRTRLGGLSLDSTYKFSFAFEANDGKTYHGSENVDKALFNSVSKGSKVRVQYHSTNPNINAAPDYGYYVSVSQIPEQTPLFRLCFSLGVFGFGGVLLYIWFGAIAAAAPSDPSYSPSPFPSQGAN